MGPTRPSRRVSFCTSLTTVFARVTNDIRFPCRSKSVDRMAGPQALSVQELPTVGAVESPHLNRLQHIRIEIAQVNAVAGTGFRR